MFLGSANHLMTFLLSYYVWETSKIQVTFWFKRFSRLPKHSFLDKKSSKFISSRAKVTGWSHDQCFIVNFIIMSRNVMSRHVTSCHVMPRHVASCYVISCRKSRDGHTTNTSLSTDFFHTQLIQIKHDRVRWLSRRLPIPHRISGI